VAAQPHAGRLHAGRTAADDQDLLLLGERGEVVDSVPKQALMRSAGARCRCWSSGRTWCGLHFQGPAGAHLVGIRASAKSRRLKPTKSTLPSEMASSAEAASKPHTVITGMVTTFLISAAGEVAALP